MSNYNSQLQSNNIDLQTVLQTLQTKAAGGGNSENEAAIIMGTVSNCTNSQVTSIKQYTFNFCRSLITADFPACTTIGNSAFYHCDSLITADFPACTTIGNSAFDECFSLTTANFPAATSIGLYAFQYCHSLITADFPACTTIENSAFGYCSSLTTANFPACTTIGAKAFNFCRSLTTANFPAATIIQDDAFGHCHSLTTVSFPACTTIGTYAFANCSSLTTANFPACTTIGANAFDNCDSLTTVSFPACTTIRAKAFDNCDSLISVFLAKQAVAALSNSNAFSNTKMSTTGWFYVPSSLIANYKTATNWTYYSSRFSAIENSPAWNGVYGEVNSDSEGVIKFMIDGEPFQALKDMTWSEWCNSDYNHSGIDSYILQYICSSDGLPVLESDIIIPGESYYT